MREEEKIFAGQLFHAAHPELKAIKLRSHKLCREYSLSDEDEYEKRERLMYEIVGEMGEGAFMQGPIYFHYGVHTKIGKNFFANYDFTVQDDTWVTIGDNVAFGPKCTIVTPIHPLLPDERYMMINEKGERKRLVYAKPVKIGSDCWFGAGVTVCSGVTIGEGCVIGAGSVVTRDIPPHSFAAGNPCRVKRTITEADSMKYKPEILADNRVIEQGDES
ncbi:MAG: sugar O-acetyltransferase [Clostridia bacterium]|nr:sugar O-acetyltransferase [Clostridia bacterium]